MKTSDAKVYQTSKLNGIFRRLKKLGAKVSYPRPTDKKNDELSFLFFADSSRINDVGRLGVSPNYWLDQRKETRTIIYFRECFTRPNVQSKVFLQPGKLPQQNELVMIVRSTAPLTS